MYSLYIPNILFLYTYKRRGAESRNRADHTDHFIQLSNRSGGLYGLYHCRRDVNTPNEGKCLVEYMGILKILVVCRENTLRREKDERSRSLLCSPLNVSAYYLEVRLDPRV